MEAHAPNTSQHLIDTERGQYLIQVSWPMGWNPDGTTDGSSIENIPIIYLVDGNIYFFTATDVVRRLQHFSGKKAIIVGVGYPITDSVVSDRRNSDLTTPSKELKRKHPIGRDGKPLTDICFGEADGFLSVLIKEIMPFVENKVLPLVPLWSLTHVLFGHSFGGLFTLYTMFTRPDLFDTYIAASPSIWWNDRSIVHEQERAFLKGGQESSSAPSVARDKKAEKPNLYLTYGVYEQYPPKRSSDSDEQYEKRKEEATGYRMVDNTVEMKNRLQTSGKFEELWMQEFAAEDHGGASVAGLQRGIMRILEEY